jgi:leucyl/phenylalanyl-tRNA--protein transferase
MLPEELQPEHLLTAYANGVFPMGENDGSIAWYCPDPRAVFNLSEFKTPRSLRQVMRHGDFAVRINDDFERTMQLCADREDGTWITPPIIEAYCALHDLGLAHSVESFKGNELAGGLYGATLGGAFFGESMFTRITDGSKVALVALIDQLLERRFTLLDIQFITPHLARFGAVEIPRDDYMKRLGVALQQEVSFVD